MFRSLPQFTRRPPARTAVGSTRNTNHEGAVSFRESRILLLSYRLHRWITLARISVNVGTPSLICCTARKATKWAIQRWIRAKEVDHFFRDKVTSPTRSVSPFPFRVRQCSASVHASSNMNHSSIPFLILLRVSSQITRPCL